MGEKFYIDTNGNDDNSYKLAFQFAVSLFKSNNQIKKIIFLVGSKSYSTE